MIYLLSFLHLKKYLLNACCVLGPVLVGIGFMMVSILKSVMCAIKKKYKFLA